MTQVELRNNAGDYIDAMRSVRCAKNITWLLIFVALALQIGAFITMQFTTMLDPIKTPAAASFAPPAAEATPAPATVPATAPAAVVRATTQPAAANAADQARMIEGVLYWALPIAKMAAPLLALLLSLTLLLGVLMILAGRLGGARGMVSAFFWSLILLVLLVPWQAMLPGATIWGVFSDLGEMEAHVARFKAAWGGHETAILTHYLRFLALPGLALLVWLIAGLKFACGYRKMTASTALPAVPAPELNA